MAHADETEETKPEGTTLYTIHAWQKQIDPDGKWWIEARATDGTVISLANFVEGEYQVVIDDPRGPRFTRSYSGGAGSLAHDRYVRFLELDESPPSADTNRRQDE